MIRNHRAIAAVVLEAAAGDAAALTKLQGNDRQLADFVMLHLDDEQRGRLVGKPEGEAARCRTAPTETESVPA